MRRIIARPASIGLALAVLLASCGGDTGPAASTTTTSAETGVTTSSTEAVTGETSTSTTTETTLPAGPPLAVQGDNNEIVEAFQFLLNCNGYGDLTVDGSFGPATLTAVEAAQRGLDREVNGAPDDGMMADLSRSCSESRRLEGEGVMIVVGNAAPEDPEVFSIALLSGTTLVATVTQGTGLTVTVTDTDGSEVAMQDESTWEIDTTQDFLIEVDSPSDSMTFELTVNVTAGTQETGDWILATDSITYRGTRLALGDDAQTVIDQVFDFLGHGVRGAYDEFDTGWYPITDPQPLGLRGISVEGFAFLFYGPDPSDPDRPETFARWRFEGPTRDANGNARPDDYATTAEGITVGDTLADLSAAYGDQVTAGSNSEESYYRLTDFGGEMCFYFGPNEPTGFSLITEIASECRSD